MLINLPLISPCSTQTGTVFASLPHWQALLPHSKILNHRVTTVVLLLCYYNIIMNNMDVHTSEIVVSPFYLSENLKVEVCEELSRQKSSA